MPLRLALLFYSPLPLTSSDYLIPRYSLWNLGSLLVRSLYTNLLCRMLVYFRGRTHSTAESSVGFPPKFPSAPHHASLSCLLPKSPLHLTLSVGSLSTARGPGGGKNQKKGQHEFPLVPFFIQPSVFSFPQHMTSATTR